MGRVIERSGCGFQHSCLMNSQHQRPPLSADGYLRDGKWSESIAVGSESFVTMTKEKLGIKAKGRKVVGEDGSYVLQEPPASYNGIFGLENGVLRAQNEHFWEDSA